MEKSVSGRSKKEVMREIILKLHQGLSVEEAKNIFEREVGSISSTEIAELEQSLINDGIPPDEIKKFCNVHALLFQNALSKAVSAETFPSHPVFLFKQENREIEKRVNSIKELFPKKAERSIIDFKKQLRGQLLDLKNIDTHYVRKEQLLFPYLEKKGFVGPSKVMWGKDNDVREMLKKALNEIETVNSGQALEVFSEKFLNPMLEEVIGMIFKEESILFPAAIEKLSPDEWASILRDSSQIGYVFIPKPLETEKLLKEFESAIEEEPAYTDGSVKLPTGEVLLTELLQILNSLPFDLTFVDKDDRVKYFSDGKHRIFPRTKSIIGRQVQMCHPPQSVDRVIQILDSFKQGKKDLVEFWLNVGKSLIYIQYLAIRDRSGKYLGTLEISQDISRIHKLEGEKRLLNEGD